MEERQLNYLKAMIEERADVSFSAWFKNHEAELKDKMPRASFLRLKFSPVEEAIKLLGENGIEFEQNDLAIRAERYYLTFHPSTLDEKGRVQESHKRKIYGGAIGKMLDGDFAGAKQILNKQLSKISKLPLPKRADELSGILYFGEIETAHGDPKIGKFVIDLIATLPLSQSYSDDLIMQARKFGNKSD